MATFIKPFKGVQSGDVYHTDFEPGQECPPELEPAARSVGAVAEDKTIKKAPEAK